MLAFRIYWSPCPILVLVCISWTLRAAYCKPLQQQSNDRILVSDDRLAITTVYDLDSIGEVTLDSQSQNDGADIRLEKLSRTMNALAQFRQVINNRLLAGNALVSSAEDTRDDYPGLQRQTFLVRADAGRTAQQKTHRSHYHHKRKPHERTNTNSAVTTRPFAREHRDDPELQSNAYRVQGFNIKAHLQPEPGPTTAPGRDSGRAEDEQGQRFMTGRTTTIDERVLPDLPQPEFECPRLNGKTTQVLCPSRRRHGYRVCIPDTALCNEKLDCPNGEDEDPVNCLFYKTTIHHFRLVVDAVVELSDLVKQQQRRRGLDEL